MNDRPVKVCMFTNLFPPVVSGSSTQSSALARELVRRGHQACVITARLSSDAPTHEQIEGVDVYRLPALRLPELPISLNFPWLNATFCPANLRRIWEILDRHQPDVLHLHNHMFDMALSAVLAARRRGLPLVVTIHTIVKHPKEFYNIFLYPFDRLLLRHLIIESVDMVLSPEATIQGYVSDAFGNVRQALVPYGICLPQQPDPQVVARIKAEYDLEGRPVILSLGHVHEIRNRKDLIEAMPEVLKVFPNAVMLVVGAVGTETPRTLARELGVDASVIFTGAVPHSDVRAYLEIADLEAHWFVVSNPQNKTLGIAALEAMSTGTVVMGTADEDVYGKGVLRNRENVILTKAGDPSRTAREIIKLLHDPARRKAIGARAKQTIEDNFSWDSVCAKTVEAYRQAQTLRSA